jgi:ubiquinone/menaquinone biosynthesis C-methylase UbiE
MTMTIVEPVSGERAAILKRLNAARVGFQALLGGLTDADLRSPSGNPAWTNGAVLTHLVWSLELLPREVAGARKGQGMFNFPPPLRDLLNAWGTRLAARDQTLSRLRQRYETAFTGALATLDGVSDDELHLGARFWSEGFRDVAGLYAAQADHVSEHGADIRRVMPDPSAGTSLRPNVLERLTAARFDRFTARREQQGFGAHRRRLLQQAHGDVLDVGVGTGANLSYYRAAVEHVALLDPHPGMLARAASRATGSHVNATVHLGSAERLPFADASFDTVVFTKTLCTVKDVTTALKEAARVLRPGGRLLVLEHVRSHDPRLARWQDRLAPMQRLFSNGCNPNRDTSRAIQQAGFEFDWLEQFDEPKMPLPIVRPLILGSATLRP